MEIKIGLQNEAKAVVCESNTAAAVGSGALPVFATPCMLALMEKAAMDCVQPYLDEGQGTVGTKLEVTHDAATPVGMAVRATAEVTAVEGRRIVFQVEAFDEAGKIGGGVHERFVIANERFLAKCNAKLEK